MFLKVNWFGVLHNFSTPCSLCPPYCRLSPIQSKSNVLGKLEPSLVIWDLDTCPSGDMVDPGEARVVALFFVTSTLIGRQVRGGDVDVIVLRLRFGCLVSCEKCCGYC